jgi:hypothetical protein
VTAQAPQIFWHLNTNTSSILTSGAETLDYLSFLDVVYAASLLAPESVKQSSTDLWNNVKVPMLEALPANSKNVNRSTWVDINPNPDIIYSSLAGIPVAGIPKLGTANFSMESSYLWLNCTSVARNIDPFSEKARRILTDITLQSNSSWDPLFNGSGTLAGRCAWDQSSWFLSSTASLSVPSTESKRFTEYWHMVFGSRQITSTNAYAYTIFNCTIGDTRVESQVFCKDSSCAVNRIRQSQVDRRPPWTTPFNGKIMLDNENLDSTSFDDDQWNALLAMTTGLPWATGVIDHNVPAPVQRYLVGDTDVIDPNPLSTELGNVDYSNVSAEQFSQRLTTLVNTYWQTSLAPRAITTNQPTDLAVFVPLNDSYSQLYPANSTLGITTTSRTIYKANYDWIVILFALTFILQICAIAGFVFKVLCIAPDILGYVSSMTRENPHTPLPPGGSALSGLERARLLKDVQVQVGDVSPEEKYGCIAMSTSTGLPGRITKRRLYM